MHSLLCCGILRVPSQKKREKKKKENLYKTFVEIFSSHARYVQSYFGHGWLFITIQKKKKKKSILTWKGKFFRVYFDSTGARNMATLKFVRYSSDFQKCLPLFSLFLGEMSLLYFYPSEINQEISIMLLPKSLP